MELIVNNNEVEMPAGILYFKNEKGFTVRVRLVDGAYALLDMQHNRVNIPDLKLYTDMDNIFENIKEVYINIDGWFHIFYELKIHHINPCILRVTCAPRNEK